MRCGPDGRKNIGRVPVARIDARVREHASKQGAYALELLGHASRPTAATEESRAPVGRTMDGDRDEHDEERGA